MPMSAKDVSIIIPVYNVEAYIEECIRSVMAQTFIDGLECIIVDDCGSDCSMDIATQMIAAYDGPIQFNILHHDHNCGLSAARNTGIRAAKGEWLYFLDSDDYIKPECISTLMGFVKKYPDVEMVQGSTFIKTDFSDNVNQWLDMSFASLPEYIDEIELIQKSKFAGLLPPTATSKLVKHDFVLTYNLYFLEGVYHEDEHWSFYLCKHLRTMAISTEATYIYRKREGSITGESYERRHYKSMIKIFSHIIPDIEGECKQYQLRFAFSFIFGLYSNSVDPYVIKAAKSLIVKLSTKANSVSRVILLMICLMPRKIIQLRLVNWNLIQVRIARHIS